MQGKSQTSGGRQSAWRSFAVTLRMLPCLRLRRSCSRQHIGVLWLVGVEVICVQSCIEYGPTADFQHNRCHTSDPLSFLQARSAMRVCAAQRWVPRCTAYCYAHQQHIKQSTWLLCAESHVPQPTTRPGMCGRRALSGRHCTMAC